MFKKRVLLINQLNIGLKNAYSPSQKFSQRHNIKADKILIVSKMTKYDYERKKYKDSNEEEMLRHLSEKGVDVEKIIKYHDQHKHFQDKVIGVLKDMGISVEIVNRFTCTREHVKQADIVMPVGGDGTFLLAASKVLNNQTPVIGINSDPTRSEGYLCLPKKYSSNIKVGLQKILAGRFEWLMRSRIRTTLIVSDESNFVPNYIHDVDDTRAIMTHPIVKGARVLPVLALNEVFVGEKLAARVSHLNVRLNGSSESTNMKCSGICVSTGTGSTSWHSSINRLSVQTVADILRLIDIHPVEGKDSLANVVADMYNKNLLFSPDHLCMAYTIREMIQATVWPDPKGIKPRGFVSKLEIKSNCYDASLVFDGGVSFAFNDGTTALLEIHPEDALKTVVLKD